MGIINEWWMRIIESNELMKEHMGNKERKPEKNQCKCGRLKYAMSKRCIECYKRKRVMRTGRLTKQIERNIY